MAVRVLEDLGLEDEIPVAALAKHFEEVFVPGQADPIRIPRQSEALYLLQRSATRPTASPSPTTASCGASA